MREIGTLTVTLGEDKSSHGYLLSECLTPLPDVGLSNVIYVSFLPCTTSGFEFRHERLKLNKFHHSIW